MADGSIPEADDAFELYTAPGLAPLIQTLSSIERVAGIGGARAIEAAATTLVEALLDSANAVAEASALASEIAIVHEMFATQSPNRPHTGNMESHVVSRPGPMGTVFVALMSELDKIVNDRGEWGPFWRAQEYGTGSAEVPSQLDRVLFGTFYESETPPEGAQAGLGVGHDLAFVPMGSAPGLGRINVELPGRHFLRNGADAAGAEYLKAHEAIEAHTLAGLREIQTMSRVMRAEGSITGVIEM